MKTEDYLAKNGNSIETGIHFTINDLIFMKRNNFDSIIINGTKPTEEEISEKEIIRRLRDLLKLAKADNRIQQDQIDRYEKTFSKLESDFGLIIKEEQLVKTDMRTIWAQKLREIEEEIRNTMWGDKKRLEYLGARKEWLEFGFQACGGQL